MCLTFAVRLWFLICIRQWQVLFIYFLKSVLKRILLIPVGSFSNSCPNFYSRMEYYYIFLKIQRTFLLLLICSELLLVLKNLYNKHGKLCPALGLDGRFVVPFLYMCSLWKWRNTHETITCLLCSFQNAEVSWEIMLFVPPCLAE